MRIGAPKETRPLERRVAATPESIKTLRGLGYTVVVEPGAGAAAGYPDEAYVQQGAELGDAWAAEIIVKVQPPTPDEVAKAQPGALLISLLQGGVSFASVGPDTAREWLSSAFDLAVEIARLRDGRHRVMRVAELQIDGNRVVPRDIFTFVVERTAAGGAVEGSFVPSGVVPAIADDLIARGAAIDLGMFKR